MNALPEIPDKLFFRIGEVSRIAQVPASVLRFWESEFPRIRPKRTDSGQRLYRKYEVELILTIRYLLYERKFTIKGARNYLKSSAADPTPVTESPPATALQAIVEELQDIRKLLE